MPHNHTKRHRGQSVLNKRALHACMMTFVALSFCITLACRVGFGVSEARSLSRRRQQIALDNRKLRTVDQAILNTYKTRIFQADDISYMTYQDDEDDDEPGALGSSISNSHARSIGGRSRVSGRSHGTSSRLSSIRRGGQEGRLKELEENQHSHSQRVFSRRVDFPRFPGTLRNSYNHSNMPPHALGRRSCSFDETLYGGLESGSRRGQCSVFAGGRASLNRDDRCHTWTEHKADAQDDHGGASESIHGFDQEKEYKPHAKEERTGLEAEKIQPLDGAKSYSELNRPIRRASMPSMVSSPAETKSKGRSELPALPGLIAIGRGSAGGSVTGSLHSRPTPQHNNRFGASRRLESEPSSPAGPSLAGFLPDWLGGARRRSSMSTVAVPDNGRGMPLRRSSQRAFDASTHPIQSGDEEGSKEKAEGGEDGRENDGVSGNGGNSEADDGRGVGQIDVSAFQRRGTRRSLQRIHTMSLDEDQPEPSTKSPIEEYKERFSSIGIDLPDVYAPTGGELSRLSLDADDMAQNDASQSRSRQPSRRSSQRLDELRDSGRQSILRPSIHNSRRGSAIGGISRSSTRSSRPGAALPRGQHDKELTTDTVVASTSGPAPKQKSKNRRYDPCAICLEEYEVGDHIRELPCRHFFHSHCIDPWFRDVHGICPVCKRDYSQGKP